MIDRGWAKRCLGLIESTWLQSLKYSELWLTQFPIAHGIKLEATLRNIGPMKEVKWSTVEFEEAASRDFMMAGRYGNEIGKGLAVSTNPTAKLCGEMVKEAMRKEYAGGMTDAEKKDNLDEASENEHAGEHNVMVEKAADSLKKLGLLMSSKSGLDELD
jgi:hypothetical protein